MPVTFSEKYNLSNDVIVRNAVFDVIMDLDTKVFIDPALLEFCEEAEFADAKIKTEKYFADIITLLRHSKSNTDMYWKKANTLLTFKEIVGTCFGYSKKSTSGNAIGTKLRKSILLTIKELISEGENDPTLFELLGVFQENIGCDRISDLLTSVLYENILNYTNRVVMDCGIECVEIKYKNNVFRTCINPYNNSPLLLLPKTILSPLPIADDFDDIDLICMENQRVRDAINAYFDLGNRKKLSKSQILTLMKHSVEFRQALLQSYKTAPKSPYDFQIDPAGEYIWYSSSKKYANEFPLNLSDVSLNNIDDVYDIVKKICLQYKTLIEDNGLSKLLYDSNGNPKRESAAQLLFYGIADSYCNANDVDLSPESNAGRGPVDFKLSRGARDKVIVEVKLTSNSQIKHGVDTQVPIYMTQEKTKKAIYLVIDNGHPKTLENFIKYYNALNQDTKNKIECVFIDGTAKLSASKA